MARKKGQVLILCETPHRLTMAGSVAPSARWLVETDVFFASFAFPALAMLVALAAAWFFRSKPKGRAPSWVLVTGAARGLGLAMVKLLAQQGASNIILADLSKEALSKATEELRNELGGRCPRLLSFPADVSSPEQVEALVAFAHTVSGGAGLDVVISNAGIVTGANVDELQPSQLQKAFSVNVFASFYLAKALLPRWKKQIDAHSGTGPEGPLVKSFCCISSIMGMSASARLSDYAATKWALLAFTESLRLELQRDGYGNIDPLDRVGSGPLAKRNGRIDVISILPFAARTGMFAGIFEDPRDWNPVRSFFFPMLSAEQVAEAVVSAIDAGGDQVVAVPRAVYWLAWAQKALPLWAQDRFSGYFGGHHGMSSFAGSASAIDTKVVQAKPSSVSQVATQTTVKTSPRRARSSSSKSSGRGKKSL